MDRETRWRFFNDGLWRWHRSTLAGRILAECACGFPTLQECVRDAARFGYPLNGATVASAGAASIERTAPEAVNRADRIDRASRVQADA